MEADFCKCCAGKSGWSVHIFPRRGFALTVSVNTVDRYSKRRFRYNISDYRRVGEERCGDLNRVKIRVESQGGERKVEGLEEEEAREEEVFFDECKGHGFGLGGEG